MLTDQMRGLADLADKFGSGTIRMTVWQNLPDLGRQGGGHPDFSGAGKTWGSTGEPRARGAGWSPARGNAGCKFAASNTKKHALAVADHLDACLELGQPINIHLTGCPNSCAQHYLGDIGMMGTAVSVGEDMVEGYHVYIGAATARTSRSAVKFIGASSPRTSLRRRADAPAYLEHRESADEPFNDFVRRHPTDVLKAWFESSPLTPA